MVRVRFQTFQDEQLRAIAIEKLQGYSNREIVDRQKVHLRAAERILRLIRRLLAQEKLDRPSHD